MTFDWNSSSEFENGHHRSNVTPLIGVSNPSENSCNSDFDEIETLCISHYIRQIRGAKSWNYGHLPYLVANTYGLNVIKIGGIWIFWGAETPYWGGVAFDLWCPISNSDELFQSKVMCENLVWIGWNRRHVDFEGGGRPPISGGYMWSAMPIFEHGQSFLNKSHMWKFGSDW